MTHFDEVNFMVLPVEDPKLKRPQYHGRPLPWKEDQYYCSWEEREDIYPGVTDWYVVPSSNVTYYKNGVEIGYYIIDIDNHDGDNFKGAIEFLRQCQLPRSLTVRTPSGGLHIYYWTLRDELPDQVGKSNPTGLPIEIKSRTGVLAPNGRDRVVTIDEPIAHLSVSEGTLFSEIARLRPKTAFRVKRKPIDPNYVLPPPLALPESSRHDTMIRKAKQLQDDGCPDELVLKWLYQTRELSPGTRPITERELLDIVGWEGSAIETPDLQELLAEIDDTNRPAPKLDFMEQATPLTGWEKVFGQVLFSDKDEAMGYIMDEAATIPDADADLVAPLLTATTMDELKSAWVVIPPTTQLQYVWLKDCMKHALSLA